MAISVKQFTNPLNCDEPAYQLDVKYSSDAANGASIICNGNGTDVSIFGDYANLGDIYTNGSSGSASNTDICLDGIDVVFALDYTASMDESIDGAKAGISNIINAIDTASGGNYRIGIVIYDEYNGSSGVTFNYASSTYYTDSIPDSQKFINEDAASGHTQTFTCMEKMDQVGNSTSAQAALNVLNHAGGNSSTGMALGSGAGTPEPGGQCIYKIAQDNFAGTWRAGVMRMIINITDNNPGGYDDSYGGADESFFQNTIEPFFEAHQIVYYHNTGSLTSAQTTNDLQTYKYLADNTLPVGLYSSGTNYDSGGLWTANLIVNINELCADTVTYTCDPAPAGWYADTPIVAGSTVVYYWDGSAWTNTYTCPEPQYTVTVDIIDSIGVEGSVNDIASNHPNYSDVDTFTFTGIQGSQHTATIGTTVATDYEDLVVTVDNISDSAVITSASVNNLTDEVTIQVTIGGSSSSEDIEIFGTADQVVYTMRLDVVNSISDLTNALGSAQSPTGEMNPTPETPASGWTDVASTYLNYAQRYEFTGVVGSSHTFDVNFTPVPSDYSVSASLSTELYHNISGGGGTQYAPMYNAFNGNYTVSAGEVTGTVAMPSGGGWAKLFIGGESNQPIYRFTLNSSETITGASMASGDTQQFFQGYTGDTFNFESLVTADAGYNNASVSSVGLNNLYPDNASITSVTQNGSNTGAVGSITMPAGGGEGGIILAGSASQISYDFVITIVDDLSTASWGQVTFSGFAGSSHSQNATFLSSTDYVYNLTSITDNSSDLSSSIVNATSGIIGLSLPSMPLGGGSATVTVSGEESGKIYDFDLSISTDSPVAGSFNSSTVTIQGVAGSVNTGTFTFTQANDYTYSATGTTVSNATHITQAQLQSTLFTTDYSVTMPSGGGTGTITVDGATSTQTVHDATIIYDTSTMSDTGSNHSGSFSAGTPASTGVYDATIISTTTGTTVPFVLTLTPSPSYFEIQISQSGPNGAGAWTVFDTDSMLGPLTWNGTTYELSGNLIMPQGGGTATLRPSGKINNPAFTFTVTAQESIANASLATTSYQFSGITGSTHQHTFNIVPDAGYTTDVTSVNVGNSYSGALTAAPTVAEDILVSLTMPVNGGAALITAFGNSTPITYVANLNFDTDSGNNMNSRGAWDSSTVQFTGVAGSTHSIDNTWRMTDSSYTMNSDYTVAISPSSIPFSGITGGSASNGDTDDRLQATFTMPIGGGTWTATATGSTTIKPTFGCKDVAISIISGAVGSAISYTSSFPGGGSVASVSPSTYQLGSNTYTFTINVPNSGYTNSGGQITCDIIGTGTTTLPTFTCTDFNTLFSNTSQVVGQQIQFTWDGNPPPITISPYVFNPPTYQLGSNSYDMDFIVPPGYANEGDDFSCSFTVVGTTTTTTLPSFDCTDTSIVIADGAVGAAVVATKSDAKGKYTIGSISPSTYQLGSQNYAVNVVVPSGYSNSGSTITCFVTGVGTTTLPLFNCDDAVVTIGGSNLTGDNVAPMVSVTNGTFVSASPSTFQTGTNTYTITVTAPSGYSNSGSNIDCDVSHGPVADPCESCNGALNIAPDYHPYTGTATPGTASHGGWITIWTEDGNPLPGQEYCSFATNQLELFHSTTGAVGSFTSITSGSSPVVWEYKDDGTTPTARTDVPGLSINNRGLIGNLAAGYYYVTGVDGNGCTQTSKTIYLAATTAELNAYKYLYGVECGSDNSNGAGGGATGNANSIPELQNVIVNTDPIDVYSHLYSPLQTVANGAPNNTGEWFLSGPRNLSQALVVKVPGNLYPNIGDPSDAWALTGSAPNATGNILFAGYALQNREYTPAGNNPAPTIAAAGPYDCTNTDIRAYYGKTWNGNHGGMLAKPYSFGSTPQETIAYYNPFEPATTFATVSGTSNCGTLPGGGGREEISPSPPSSPGPTDPGEGIR